MIAISAMSSTGFHFFDNHDHGACPHCCGQMPEETLGPAVEVEQVEYAHEASYSESEIASKYGWSVSFDGEFFPSLLYYFAIDGMCLYSSSSPSPSFSDGAPKGHGPIPHRRGDNDNNDRIQQCWWS
jgi:hypothetical protein